MCTRDDSNMQNIITANPPTAMNTAFQKLQRSAPTPPSSSSRILFRLFLIPTPPMKITRPGIFRSIYTHHMPLYMSRYSEQKYRRFFYFRILSVCITRKGARRAEHGRLHLLFCARGGFHRCPAFLCEYLPADHDSDKRNADNVGKHPRVNEQQSSGRRHHALHGIHLHEYIPFKR